MTNLLYNQSSYIKTFTASVLSCEMTENGYAVTLDRTAFFPEQGGQYADEGVLGGARVTDVQLRGGIVIHTLDAPLEPGSTVEGVLDWETRYDRMQNHTGEHLVSGCIHAMFGYDNVGFHMNDELLTLDTSGELSAEQLQAVERRANEAVFANVPVEVTYPAPQVLETLEYRAKLALTEDVRIVTIPGWDACACCAPHVASTGEVGLIKITDAIRYKGGMRITLKCGRRALADYECKQEVLTAIAQALSAKPEEAYEAFQRQQNVIAEQKGALLRLKKELLSYKLAALAPTEGNLCVFEPDADADTLRAIVNAGIEKCGGICAAFSGDDAHGYLFVIGAKQIPLRTRAKEITAALNGRGGGSDQMISGTVRAAQDEIRAYVAAFS